MFELYVNDEKLEYAISPTDVIKSNGDNTIYEKAK